MRDLLFMDVPMRHILVECTRTSGWPPLWNPFSGGGQPLAANPHFAVFHPLSFFFFILPWHWAFSLQILLPLVVSFFGMLLFLRKMGCSNISALFGSVSWAFGGYYLSLTNLLPMLWTISPLPWALAFTLQLNHGEDSEAENGPLRLRSLFANSGATLKLSIALALIFLGAEPQSIIACCTVIVLFFLSRSSWSSWKSILPQFGLSGLLALGLSACVLLPAMGLALKSSRGTRMNSSPSSVWSLAPARLLELISPPFTPWPVDTEPNSKPSHPLYPEQGAPLVASLYSGLGIAALAIFGFFRQFKSHIFEALLIVVGAAMALGRASPIWSVVSTIPLMRLGRYPEKWSLLLVFGMILCASRTLHEVLAQTNPKIRRELFRSILCIGAILILLRLATQALGWSSPNGSDALRSLTGLGLGFLFFPLVFYVPPSRSLRQGLVVSAFLLLLTGFSISNSRLVTTRDSKDLFEIPQYLSPIANRHQAGRLFHLASLRSGMAGSAWMAPPPMTAIWGVRSIFERDLDLSRLRWSRQATKMNLDFFGAYPQLTMPQLARYGVGSMAKLMNRGCEDPSQLAVALVPVPEPAPYISCVDKVWKIQDPKEWSDATINALARKSGSFIVIEGRHAGLPENPSPCGIQIESAQPNRLVGIVNAKGPRLSVIQVNQTWDPGWRLHIDGKETEIFRNDICFSSFALPPGKHHVVLEYHDSLVTMGIGISCSTGLLILLLVAAYFKHKRFEEVPIADTRSPDPV